MFRVSRVTCVMSCNSRLIIIIIIIISLSIGKGSTKGSKPVRGASLTQHTCYNDKITKQRASYIYT